MRRIKFSIVLLFAAVCGNNCAQTVEDIAAALADMPGYRAQVSYAVTLPQAQDDVVYTVDLAQDFPNADSYLLQWLVLSPSGPVDGFTAWFDGNFYNYRNHRLQERHEQWDAPLPEGVKPPQNSAQFASLLPSRIAQTLPALGDDVEIKVQGDVLTVSQVTEASELFYKFQLPSMRPIDFYADYNPGAISGQQVHAVYTYPDVVESYPAGFSEEFLRSLFPDAFEKYRESQFAIENMRGLPLPGFSLPKLGGGRVERQALDPFRGPVAVVLLNPAMGLSPRLVEAVRAAVDALPIEAEVIWASTAKNPDETEQLLGTLRPGETALTGAQPLVSACGASALPVVLVCSPSGRISDIAIGLNQTLHTDVMQMLISAK